MIPTIHEQAKQNHDLVAMVAGHRKVKAEDVGIDALKFDEVELPRMAPYPREQRSSRRRMW